MFDELSDQEKSVMLAKLWGWEMEYEPPKYRNDYGTAFLMSNGKPLHAVQFRYPAAYPSIPNLYDPVNMSLAWLGLNWADTNLKGYDALDLYFWWDKGSLLSLPPEKAQRAWLDKILELAIEAGMLG